jgi:hypothetical protein
MKFLLKKINTNELEKFCCYLLGKKTYIPNKICHNGIIHS